MPPMEKALVNFPETQYLHKLYFQFKDFFHSFKVESSKQILYLCLPWKEHLYTSMKLSIYKNDIFDIVNSTDTHLHI